MRNQINLKINGSASQDTAQLITSYIQEFIDSPYRLNRVLFPFSLKKAHLSFYPLSKNLRMVASEISRNLEFGASTKLSNKARRGEPKHVKKILGWTSWYPWIWSRSRDGAKLKNSKAWFLYFNFPEKSTFKYNRAKYLKTGSDEDRTLARIGIVVSVIGTLFQLPDRIMQDIRRILPNDLEISDVRTVGVHIRRGENISIDGATLRNGFTSINPNEYFDEVKKVCKELETNRIFLCTDSTEIRDLAIKELGIFELLIPNYDASNFYRPINSSEISLETIWANDPELMNFYAVTAIADLYALSRCDYIIGTHSVSEFSKTAWYLAMHHKKRFVPFSSLTGNLDLSKSDSIYL